MEITKSTSVADAEVSITYESTQVSNALYYVPAIRLICAGCGFIPITYNLMAVERHCIGSKDRGGCPAFMAKFHPFLHIQRGTPVVKKNGVGNFYYTKYRDNWGMTDPPNADGSDSESATGTGNDDESDDGKNESDDGKNQAYWETEFQNVIEQNKDARYTGWTVKQFEPTVEEDKFEPIDCRWLKVERKLIQNFLYCAR